MTRDVDVLVIGAGPAGLAAALAAAGAWANVCVIDDNPLAGGQIWRGGPENSGNVPDMRAVQLWRSLLAMPNVHVIQQARAVLPLDGNALLVETPDLAFPIRFRSLILATGARERLLPFPGWTLPGVSGAGGLQALAKAGYPVAGKRVIVAGTGPLLLAVAATLAERGARIEAIVEQAPFRRLARFALSLFATPSKLRQAMQLKARLRGVRYLSGSYVLEALGNDSLREVRIQHGRSRIDMPCDYLACGYGLVPNVELASALGCAVEDGKVRVDERQRTSIPHIFCAGESTGIGGVDLALAEGRIAGLAAAGDSKEIAELAGERTRWRAFAHRLDHAFRLRPELRTLCRPDTLVCRCEDVPFKDVMSHAGWRSAKLHTRCGMGPCQGRICGAAADFLFGWAQDSIRAPVTPTRIGSLIEAEDSLQIRDR